MKLFEVSVLEWNWDVNKKFLLLVRKYDEANWII